MGSTRRLARAPIVEAIIDITCDLPATFDLASLEEAGAKAFPSNPTVAQQWTQSLTVQATKKGVSETRSQELAALRYISPDGRELVQVRNEGFSFNRLAPYESLDSYLDTIGIAWQSYRTLVQPISISRIQLRYINKIALPNVRTDLDDYFTIATSSGWGESVMVGGFLIQYAGEDTASNNGFRVTLASEGNPLAVIFDIIALRDRRIDMDWESVRSVILSLRETKNTLFYDSLKPKCLELFQSDSAQR